jgi:acetylornithine/N-succinyldiaminopimelate aminotransferase
MITEKTHQHIFSNYGRYPLTLVRGEGAYVWDENGKKYLDFLSGIACTPLGHCHPAITKAVTEQLNTLLHTSNLYYTSPAAELAECLTKNGGLDKVFFCNSGAEANEAAIKLVRKYQWYLGKKNKNIILSATHSFHGRTLGALTATGKPSIQEGFEPLPMGFKCLDWGDTDVFCAAINDNVAAVILEPIQGESGIHVASKAFLEAVRIACDKAGALLIFDEVQCGVGRMGHLFAYQYYDVKPDIITLAKGLANGLPIGAVCATSNAASGFKAGDHGSTFGGNLVSCKAALTLLNILLNENYLSHVKKLGVLLLARLQSLQAKYPKQIKEVRGVGLMVGMEVTDNAKTILEDCREKGLLINVAGENTLRLLPPYIISEQDVEKAVEILESAFQ